MRRTTCLVDVDDITGIALWIESVKLLAVEEVPGFKPPQRKKEALNVSLQLDPNSLGGRGDLASYARGGASQEIWVERGETS